MRFVMVPVPREHVLDVMRWVLFRAPAEDDPSGMRDHVRLSTFLEATDPAIRDVLLLVAKASANGEPVPLTDVAEKLDIETAAVQALVRSVNRDALGGGRSLVRVAPETSVGVQGKTGKVLFLEMRPEHAKVVRAASRPGAQPGG